MTTTTPPFIGPLTHAEAHDGPFWSQCLSCVSDHMENTSCPACGNPIDYCPGHGEIGDPEGFAILQAARDEEPWMGYTPGEDRRPERGAFPGEMFRA